MQRGQFGQACCECCHVARACAVEREPRQQALKVEDSGEAAAQFFPAHEVAVGLGNGFITGVNGCRVIQRAQYRGSQQAFAHGRLAAVEGVEERGARVLPGD